MQHITSACFIAGAARSLFWDDVVLIFVGSGFCNGTSRLTPEVFNHIQRRSRVFEGCTLVTLNFDQANVNNLHQSNIYSPQERKNMFLDAFSSYRPIS